MVARVFAVVTLSNILGKLNTAGQAVVSLARHSVDGEQIILDFNHPRAAIDSLFLGGVDVDAVIAGCEHLSHSQAMALMATVAWKESGDI